MEKWRHGSWEKRVGFGLGGRGWVNRQQEMQVMEAGRECGGETILVGIRDDSADFRFNQLHDSSSGRG